MRSLLRDFRDVPPLALGVIAYCFGLSFIIAGFNQTFSVFLLPIAGDLKLDLGEVSAVYSASMLASGLVSPMVGVMFDRYGPRTLYGAGVALCTLAYVSAAMSTSLIPIALGLGLLGGLGLALTGGVPHAALVSRWFTAHPGTAMGVIFSAGGFATVASAPLSQVMIENLGWRETYFVFAGVMALLLPVVFAMPWRSILKGGPDWHGAVDIEAGAAAVREVWTLASALRARSFWGLFFVYFFTGASTVSLLVHMVSYLIDQGFTPLGAAAAFGLVGLLTPAGMIGFGLLGDRLGRARAAAISYAATALSILGLVLLRYDQGSLLLTATIFFFGISSGSRGPLVSAIAMNTFAGKSLGGIYGTISLGGGLGSAAGVWLGGALQDWTGTSLALIYFTAICLFLGSMPFWTIGRLRNS